MAQLLTLLILFIINEHSLPIAATTTSNSASIANHYIDITIYAPRYIHSQNKHNYYSVIIINNGEYTISFTERGLNIMIFDQFNGSMIGNIEHDPYDSAYPFQHDIDIIISLYLNSVKQNDIILVTAIDMMIDMDILHPFGCNISHIKYGASLTFIGQKTTQNHPFWTYCDTKPLPQFNDSNISDADILKTVQIPLSVINSTEQHSISDPEIFDLNLTTFNSTPLNIIESVENSNSVKNADSNILGIEGLSNTQIIVGSSLIFVCVIIPLSVGIITFFCVRKSKKTLNTIIKKEAENQIKNNNNKQNSKSKINDYEINKKRPKISGSRTVTPSGLSNISSTDWNQPSITSPTSNYSMNSKIKLDILNQYIVSKHSTPTGDTRIDDDKHIIRAKRKETQGLSDSDELYNNPGEQFLDDKTYTLRTRGSQQSSTSNVITINTEFHQSQHV